MANKFPVLDLTGNEKPKVAYLENICSLAPHMINRGDWIVDSGTFRMHQTCADAWLDKKGRQRTTGGRHGAKDVGDE